MRASVFILGGAGAGAALFGIMCLTGQVWLLPGLSVGKTISVLCTMAAPFVAMGAIFGASIWSDISRRRGA